MAKIGTAHIEVKPVLNEEALNAIVQRIEDAVEAGMTRALNKTNQQVGYEAQAAILAGISAVARRGDR